MENSSQPPPPNALSLRSTEGYVEAVECLERACTPQGILASVTDEVNYRRIWGRDSVICGLAGLMARNYLVVEGLAETLRSLAKYQGPLGQIPSNIAFDDEGEVAAVSYGTLVGRVDTIPWFVIGVCNYSALTQDASLAFELYQAAQNALKLMEAWEFNTKGLVYCPLSSDWADEYVLDGYVLLTQLLRLWALECFAETYDEDEVRDKAATLRSLISLNYWPAESLVLSGDAYNAPAAEAFVRAHGETQFWSASFSPGGYTTQFDFFGNALALILGIGTRSQQDSCLKYGMEIVQQLSPQLAPAFWPPIEPGSTDWARLQLIYLDQFRNHPNEYHNGGLWPMVTGWWGVAEVLRGAEQNAESLLDHLHRFNQQDPSGSEWGFFEFGSSKTGKVGGTRLCTWSAAAPLFITESLCGKRLLGWQSVSRS